MTLGRRRRGSHLKCFFDDNRAAAQSGNTIYDATAIRSQVRPQKGRRSSWTSQRLTPTHLGRVRERRVHELVRTPSRQSLPSRKNILSARDPDPPTALRRSFATASPPRLATTPLRHRGRRNVHSRLASSSNTVSELACLFVTAFAHSSNFARRSTTDVESARTLRPHRHCAAQCARAFP